MYAATTVGPDGMIYQGTLNGMTRYVPETVAELPPRARVDAGIEQGLDLIDRSKSGSRSGISERDYLRRAIVQLNATQLLAIETGSSDAATACAMALEALDAALAALDSGEAYAPQVDAAREALSSL